MRFLIFIVVFSANVLNIMAIEQCTANKISINPKAEARFSVIISLRRSSGISECATLNLEAIQTISSIQWAVNKINTGNYLPVNNLSIGFDVYDDCGLDRYSSYMALNAVSNKFPVTLRTCSGNATRLYLGILGPSKSQTAYTILNLLKGTNTPVLSPFASLPSLRNFSNFMRTTPVDTEQVKVIVDLMEDLGWTYVAAIHTDDNYGTNGIEGIKKLAKERGICIDTVITLPITLQKDDSDAFESVLTTLENQKKLAKNKTLGVVYFGQNSIIEQVLIKASYKIRFEPEFKKIHWIMSDFVGTSTSVFKEASEFADGTLTISTSAILFREARDYFIAQWNNIDDNTDQDPVKMLLKEYRGQPEAISVTADTWRTDITAETMHGVYVMATALKDTFRQKCQQYTSICEGFEGYFETNILQSMKTVNLNYSDMPEAAGPKELIAVGKQVQFDEYGDLVADHSTPLYSVNTYVHNSGTNAGHFDVVGNFTDNRLYLNYSKIKPSYLLSTCGSDCPGCSSTPLIPYEYIPGDVILIGIFSMHQPLPDPFSCGDLRTHTYDVIAFHAFTYALNRAKQTTGINFGAIVFDDCYSAAKISLILTQFMSNMTRFQKTASTGYIDPAKVVAIIGPSPSGVTVPVNFLTTTMNLPSISYASSSPNLDDRINFPYFLRTVPSDVQQAQAMIEIIKSMGWKYVGLLYVNNNYGAKGKEVFLEKANANGICVEQPIVLSETSENTEDELYEISLDIREKPFEVVVYFGIHQRIKDLLGIMQQRVQDGVKYNFIFLSSEDWGDSAEILNRFGTVARGSLTFKINTDTFKTVDQGFRNYIKSLSPDVRPYNSWFREFWRDYFNCNPDGGFDRSRDKSCPKDQHFTEANLDEFLKDQRVIQTMNAVYATASGFKHVKDGLCQFDTAFPCSKVKSNPDYVVRAIRNVSLPTEDSQAKVFDANGNGNVGFKILNVQYTSGSYVYKEVGTYKGNQLVLNKNDLRFYDASGKLKTITAECVGSCTKCRAQNTTTHAPFVSSTQVQEQINVLRLADIIIIAILGSLVVILLIAIIVIVCYFKRRLTDLGRDIVYNRPNMVPASYYNDERRPAVEKFKQPEFHPREIKFVNATPPNPSHIENTSNNTRQNYQELTNEQTHPKENIGIDNPAFEENSYLKVIGDTGPQNLQQNQEADYQYRNGQTNNNGAIPKYRGRPETLPSPINDRGNFDFLRSPRNHYDDRSPSSENHIDDRSPSRIDLQLPNFRPELPPRDHPSPSSHTQNSSLDSTGGHVTPNGYPRMGTSQQIPNGFPPHVSGHQSPIGLPRMGTGVQTPTIMSQSQHSPLIEDDSPKILGTFTSPKTPQQKVKRLPSQKDRKILLQNAHSMEKISRV